MNKLVLVCILILILNCVNGTVVKKITKPTSKWAVKAGTKVYCDVTYNMRWDREFQKSFDCNWNYENTVCAYGYSNKKIQKYSNPCTACFFNLKANYFIKGNC